VIAFNPAYVLPCSLGLACVGLAIWNVRMTGTISKLDKKLEISESDNDTLKECVEELNKRNQVGSAQLGKLIAAQDQNETTIRGYQQDVDTLREERRVQEQNIEILINTELGYVQKIIDLEKTVKDFTGMINTLNNKIPKRDESGKFKKKK